MEGRRRQLGADLFDPNDDPKCCAAVALTVHDRMPVILDPDAYDVWLDPGMTNVAAASSQGGSWGYRLLVVDDPEGNQLFFNI